MKKKTTIIIGLSVILVMLLSSCTPKTQEEALPMASAMSQAQSTALCSAAPEPTPLEEVVVEFEDSGFEQIIREAINKPEGEIYQSDLDVITILVIDSEKYFAINEAAEAVIEKENYIDRRGRIFYPSINTISLKDIKYLRNLEQLFLSNLEIIDIESIANLSSLSTLCIRAVDIEDLSWINKIESLQVVVINYCNLEVIPNLNNLTMLEHLDLSENGIKGSEAQIDLPNLRWLDLYINDLKEIDFIVGLSGLTYLDISANFELNDTGGLLGLCSLEELVMADLTIESLDNFSNLANLSRLDADSTALNDVEGLRYLVSLTDLCIRVEPETGLSALAELKEIEYIDIVVGNRTKYNSVIPYLAGLSNLKSLLLDSNERWYKYDSTNITDLTPLSEIKTLEDLCIYDGNVQDISPLASLENLQSLQIPNSEVVDISVLKYLPNLKILNISGNPIEDYSVLDELDLDELYK